MFVYIIPLTALLLAFMSLIASLRFIFSRQGLYWIFPAVISLILFFQNLSTLLVLGEQAPESFEYTFSNFGPFILAFLWYMMIVVFHYALKKAIPENRFINDSRKNKAEAEYLLKYEMRQNRRIRRIRKEEASDRTQVPSVPEYKGPDIG